MGEDDIYLFGFLAGLETRSRADLERALAAEQPVYLLYTLGQANWRGAGKWRSLSRLLFKADTRAAVELEAGGQDAFRGSLAETLRLAPRARTATRAEFYSLLYLHAAKLPDGAVGVRSPTLKETVLVEPRDWVNIWIYGIEIFLAGWLPKAEFRALSERLPRGSAVLQYPRTQTDNRAAPVRKLRGVEELVELMGG
jgi:hypothetical protein